jgi:hypothetical protein
MLAMLDHGVPSVSLSYYTAEHSISNWGKTGIPSFHLFFAVEDPENVRLYGFASSKEEKGRIESVVKRVRGVRGIHNEINIFPQGVGGV